MLKSNLAACLTTFIRVAQFSSYSQAAKSMHITTGAISQQLMQLESQLDFPVFERHSRGIRLTSKGKILFDTVSVSFNDIESCIDMLQDSYRQQEVRLKLTPSFAYKWLVPRLESFYRQHPEIQIQTFAEGALVDSHIRDYDIAIDYVPITQATLAEVPLVIEEQLIPVMSQSYLEKHPWFLDQTLPPQWEDVVLLHDAMPWNKAPRDYEWTYWAKQMGVAMASHQGHFFNRTDMAMSAAEAGLGVAMARMALLGNDLETGKLVAPYPPISANAGYTIITHTTHRAVDIFQQWLRETILAAFPAR